MDPSRHASPELLRRYFLGGLPEDERARVEEAYLSGEPAFAEAVAVEEELIEDYLEGRLSETERQAFRAHLLRSPRQRLSAEMVDRLLRSGASPHVAPRARPGWAPLAAGLVLAAAAGAVLWWAAARPPAQDGRVDQRSLPEPAPSVATSATPNTSPRTVSLTLGPSRARGPGDTADLEVPSGIEWVQLELELAGVEGGDFAAELRTAEGATVWRGPAFPAREGGGRRRAAVQLPAGSLVRGDYVLVLQQRRVGAQAKDAAEYFFRVLTPR